MADHYPTRHVVEKLAARSITWGQILEVLAKPEVKYGPDERGRTVYQKDNLAVVAARDGAVITALLRSTERWTDEDVRSR